MTSLTASSRRRGVSLDDEEDNVTSLLLPSGESDGDVGGSGGAPVVTAALAARTGTSHGRRFWLAWAGFFVLGTVNNLPYGKSNH